MSNTNKMLIDATHPEETRVVVLRNGRVEEFDYESAARKPLRGNIYLAKVTRVEPSLQAAFVDYGGNRHGFLAFSEIHPDYYQIPKADREALLREEAEQAAEEERLRYAQDDEYEHEDRSAADEDVEASEGQVEEGAEPAEGTGAEEAGTGSNRSPVDESAADGLRPHDLSQPCRALLRADAEHVAWRRHQSEDLERRRPQAAEVHHVGPQPAQDHGPDRPHCRAFAHQDRDQARLRLSRPPVGRDPRAYDGKQRARAHLSRQRPYQKGDPRPLSSRHQRCDRRGRGRLQGGARLHEAADAEPCPARAAALGSDAAVPAPRRRGSAFRNVPAGRPAEVGRLPGHQSDRGPGVDRHQLRPVHARAQYRADRFRDEPRGGQRDRPPASAARHGGPYRHRLHRHGAEQPCPEGREGDEGGAEE